MSLLHSFYCWGQVGTVAISTLFFALAVRVRRVHGVEPHHLRRARAQALNLKVFIAASAALGVATYLVGALFAVILLVGVVALRQLMHATRRDTAQH